MTSPTASTPGSRHHGLTFHWPRKPRVSLTLIGFLFLSIFAHALAFYLFQVAFPLVSTVPPPPAQVSILTPSTPENQALLQWIDSEDPSVISNPHEVLPPSLHDIPYQPSYAEIRTAPKAYSPAEHAIPFPPACNIQDLITATPAGPPLPAAAPNPTTLKFSGQLVSRKLVHPSLLAFTASSNSIPEPARYLIGVDAQGKVIDTYRLPSTNIAGGDTQAPQLDPALDRQAQTCLANLRFAPLGRDTIWGFATFYWGGDIYPKPASSQTPANTSSAP